MSGAATTPPKRQLTSTVLKQTLKAFVVPPVVKSYNVVAIRAVWHTIDDDRRLTHLQIAAKKKQLEMILETEEKVMLFVSAITGLEKERPKTKKQTADEDDTNQTEDGMSQESNESNMINKLGQPHIYPGVAFWIAYDVPQCLLPDIENKLEKLFLDAGLNIYECKAIRPRATKTKDINNPIDYYTSSLCQVIKDHNWPDAIEIAKESMENFIHRVFNAEFEPLGGIPMDKSEKFVSNNPEFGKRVVKVVIQENCSTIVADEVRNGLAKTQKFGFQFDLWDKSSESEGSTESFVLPVGPVKAKASSFTQSIKVIHCCMNEKGYTLHKGIIYSKVPEAKYTYIMCCTVATFLDSIVKNPSFTEIVEPNPKKLEELLTRRGCQIIPQIEINYDYIEVNPFGVCFSIAYKCFILNPIS